MKPPPFSGILKYNWIVKHQNFDDQFLAFESKPILEYETGHYYDENGHPGTFMPNSILNPFYLKLLDKEKVIEL